MVLAFDDPRGLALHCTVMHFSNFVSIPVPAKLVEGSTWGPETNI